MNVSSSESPTLFQKESPPKKWGKKILWLLILGFSVFLFIKCLFFYGKRMLYDSFTPDLAWILDSGAYILKQHQLPRHDIYSWTLSTKSWVLYQWLFEASTAFLYKIFGEQGILRTFIVFVPCLYVLFPLCGGLPRKIPTLLVLIPTTLVLLVLTVNISLRPMIVTAFFLALQYVFVHRYRLEKLSFKSLLLLSIGMYILWGNMHMGVILGLFSLLIMAVGDFMEHRKIYVFTPVVPEIEGHPQRFQRYGILLGSCFLASLVNPYGFGIYQYLTALSSKQYLNNIIIELQSPNFHWDCYQYFMGLLVIFILLMPMVKKVFSAEGFLHLLILTMCMLFVQRFVVWTCLFYAFILPKALYHWWFSLKEKSYILKYTVQGFETFRPFVLLSFVTIGFAFLFLPQYFQKVNYGNCQALMNGIDTYEHLKLPTDKLFNSGNIGSCMLVHYPHQKVFLDTRFDFYGAKYMSQTLNTLMIGSGWEQVLKQWKINTIMVEANTPLAQMLYATDQYKILYRDDSVIILRKNPP